MVTEIPFPRELILGPRSAAAVILLTGLVLTLLLSATLAQGDSQHLQIAFLVGFVMTGLFALGAGLVLARWARLHQVAAGRYQDLREIRSTLQHELGEQRERVNGLRSQLAELEARGQTAEQALAKAAQDLRKLRCTVEVTSSSVLITDARGNIEYVNPKFCELAGYQAQEVIGQNARLLRSGIHSPDFYRNLWQTITQGKIWRGELCDRKKNGEVYWESAIIAPVRDTAGEITHFVALKDDITVRKAYADELQRTQEILKQKEAFLRTMTEAAPISFYVADNRTNEIVYFNRRFCEIWGLESLKGQLQNGELKHPDVLPHIVSKVADETTFITRCAPFEFLENRVVSEAEVRLRDGRVLHHFSTQIRDEKDQYFGRLCLLEDITQRKEAEQQLAASLKQKEILLREVYHRVKNNLQVISSLLNLKSSSITDPATLRLIRETQDRVRSMALVHEKLYRAKDLSQIDFGEYAHQLVTLLSRSYRTDGKAVDVQFELDNCPLNLDTAVPCGLILNELVSNALKYAFPADLPPERPPTIRVGFGRTSEHCLVLSVGDNGVGLCPQIDLNHTNTLGLQVVSMLTEQLNGTVQVERREGTTFRITFQEQKDRLAKRLSAPAQESPPAAGGRPARPMERSV